MSKSFIRSVAKVWRLSAGVLYRTKDDKNIKPRKVYKVQDHTFHRLRFLFSQLPKIMDENQAGSQSLLTPPPEVKGMTTLERSAFEKTVLIPGMILPKKDIQRTQKLWKSQQLRRRGIKPVAELGDMDHLKSTHSLILLDPDRLVSNPFPEEVKEKLGLDSSGDFKQYPVTFTYDNWTVPEVMRAVLPSDADNVSSFTQIGHIAHLNLREESMPFKTLIGQVILDKIAAIKTVVNKVNMIDNTFRNFQMELLAGEDNYITQLREHGCDFELDFSKVYWNSRLSAEHNRIVESIEKGSIVFDVFAGIGPFAVPLAKKKDCKCLANDLNPVSYEFLQKNIQLNKIPSDQVQAFNLDGRDFIRTVVKENLIKLLPVNTTKEIPLESNALGGTPNVNNKESDSNTFVDSGKDKDNSDANVNEKNSKHSKIYIIMNLPGLAIEFLDSFNSLLKDSSIELKSLESMATALPTVHCYTFEQKSDEMDQEVQRRAESAMGMSIPGDLSVRWVRNVAPKKEMLCLTFKLWPELLLGKENKEVVAGVSNQDEEPETKKQKLSS